MSITAATRSPSCNKLPQRMVAGQLYVALLLMVKCDSLHLKRGVEASRASLTVKFPEVRNRKETECGLGWSIIRRRQTSFCEA